MNSMERMLLTLQHKEADHVPVAPLINSVSRKSLGIDYEEWSKDHEKCAEAIIRATKEIGCDCVSTLVDLSVEAADWGQEIEYSKDAAAHPNYKNSFIKSEEDYDKVGVLNPYETPRMSGHIKMAKILYDKVGQEMPVVGFVFGPLGTLSMLRGQDNLYMDLVLCPDKVKAALVNVTETLKRFSIALLESGCHAIMFDTLFASKTILSAEMWEDFEGPFIEDLSNTVREHGGMVMLHNCGDGIYIKEQIERMHPALISLCHLPPDCATWEELKEKYGDQTTFMGIIDPAFIYTATEESLRAECRKQIDALKKDGGFVLASGCEYPANFDYTLAKVMVDEARNYGRYDK